jgi:hypothetical protein
MTRQQWTEAPTHWKLDLIGNLFSVRGNYFEMASRGRMRRAHTDPLPPFDAVPNEWPLLGGNRHRCIHMVCEVVRTPRS